MKKNQWYEFLWIIEIAYFALGFFNIIFAWLGMIFFITPLLIAMITGNKIYCHKFCGRGQLFAKIGEKLSLNKPLPKFMRTPYFRYGFLAFFMTMFIIMVVNTYLVAAGSKNLSEAITLLWVFNVPWEFASNASVTPFIAQFAFGFYGIMMTSTIIGLLTMLLFKPKGFCVYCPMGTMTQGICRVKHGGKQDERNEEKCKANGRLT